MGGASAGVTLPVVLRCSSCFPSSHAAQDSPEPSHEHLRRTAGAGEAGPPCITTLAILSASLSRESFAAPMASLHCRGTNGLGQADGVSRDETAGTELNDWGAAVPL